jgi:hypothetical protein
MCSTFEASGAFKRPPLVKCRRWIRNILRTKYVLTFELSKFVFRFELAQTVYKLQAPNPIAAFFIHNLIIRLIYVKTYGTVNFLSEKKRFKKGNMEWIAHRRKSNGNFGRILPSVGTDQWAYSN